MFDRVGIVAKRGDPRVEGTLRNLVHCLAERAIRVSVDSNAAELLAGPDCPPPLEPTGDPGELLIAVGGDGTLLRAVEVGAELNTPLLGINLGRLGFLADLAPSDLGRRLNEILSGRFVEDHRVRLRWEVLREGEVLASGSALNDVVVEKWSSSRLLLVELCINGAFVNEQRCDGLIITTPTGSTAYALSGGGPILQAGLDVLGVVPICPHNLTNRPVVISGDSRIDIRVQPPEGSEAHLTSDGQDQLVLESRDGVRIWRAEQRVRLLHPIGYDYYANLRAKLHWGRGPC
jgi:NAD+ kinase